MPNPKNTVAASSSSYVAQLQLRISHGGDTTPPSRRVDGGLMAATMISSSEIILTLDIGSLFTAIDIKCEEAQRHGGNGVRRTNGPDGGRHGKRFGPKKISGMEGVIHTLFGRRGASLLDVRYRRLRLGGRHV